MLASLCRPELRERTPPLRFYGALAMVLGSAAILVVYFAANVLVFAWYLPLLYVPTFVGFACVFLQGARLWRKRIPALALAPFLFVIPFIPGFGRDLYAAVVDKSAYPDFEVGERAQNYLEVGAALYREDPDATLLTSEIGALGWGFRGRLADAIGLASPAALRFHPMPVPGSRSSRTFGAIPPGYVALVRPKFIVTLPAYSEALFKDPIINSYSCTNAPNSKSKDLRTAPIVCRLKDRP
jgi:hypothetical protein